MPLELSYAVSNPCGTQLLVLAPTLSGRCRRSFHIANRGLKMPSVDAPFSCSFSFPLASGHGGWVSVERGLGVLGVVGAGAVWDIVSITMGASIATIGLSQTSGSFDLLIPPVVSLYTKDLN